MKLGPVEITRKGVAIGKFGVAWGKRGYKLSEPARFSQATRLATRGFADDLIAAKAPVMRRIARDMARNNTLSATLFNKSVLRVVGSTGPVLRLPGNSAIERDWKEWGKSVDVAGELTWAAFWAQCFREVLVVGEAFAELTVRKGELKLRPFEPEQLSDLSLPSMETSTTFVLDGIRYNKKTGKKVSYLLRSDGPGNSVLYAPTEVREVPANRVVHLYHKERPSQSRGVTRLAPVAINVQNRDEIMAGILETQKTAGHFGVAIETEQPGGFLNAFGAETPENQGETDPEELEAILRPGGVTMLNPGEKVHVLAANTPSPEVQRSHETMAREASAAMGVPSSEVLGDFSKVNYTSGRMEDRATDPAVFADRAMLEQGCSRIFMEWLRVRAIMNGGNVDAAEKTARKVGWSWPVKARSDPEKETRALEMELNLGVKSWEEAVKERGRDPEELLAEIAKATEYEEKYGVNLPKPGGTSVSAPVAPEAAPEDDADGEDSEIKDESEEEEAVAV